MSGLPIFAVKPFAECVGVNDLSVEEMGKCRLQFGAQCVDVVIVRYHQNYDDLDVQDGSKHVELLGMRRSEDIWCADVTRMIVSVLGIELGNI